MNRPGHRECPGPLSLGFPVIPAKNILAPTDFSETANRALVYAKALARTLGASLHVLHVMQDPLVYVPILEGYGALPNFREQTEKEVGPLLTKVQTEADQQGLEVQVAMQWGNPFVEIIRYSKEHQIDLVVMGTHGRSPLEHILLGSVAEKVVRKGICPVLLVRPDEHSNDVR